MGIFGKNIDILKSIYGSTYTRIKLNRELSDRIRSTLGVRQGDPLSAFLFIVFINDFEKFMIQNGIGVKMAAEIIACLLFADDIIIFADSAEMLQQAADLLDRFCADMDLEVGLGESKTQYMIVRPNNKDTPDINLTYRGHVISRTKFYKYVGTMITDDGLFMAHAEDRHKKGSNAVENIKRLGYRYDQYTPKQLWELFQSNVESTLLAGQECMLGTKWDAKPLDDIHYNFLRYLSGVARDARATTNTSALDLELINLAIPPKIKRQIVVVKYWVRLMSQKRSSALAAATIASNELADTDGCWMSALKDILRSAGFINRYMIAQRNPEDADLDRIVEDVSNKLMLDHIASCRESLKGSKYSLIEKIHIKTDPTTETFHQHIRIRRDMQAMARFRLSCHGLAIETGRWTKNHTPREERLCKHCARPEVDDEDHVFFRCEAHLVERQRIRQKLRTLDHEGFSAFNNEDLPGLLRNQKCMALIASYIFKLYKGRKELDAI
jgi:hypothetical protein